MKQLEHHEISTVYPMMSKKEYQGLLASIEENGYEESLAIYLYEGKILDGRNRYKACKELNVEPCFSEFTGSHDEAVEKSRMLNSHRRHMPKYQRAMIAAMEIQASRENSDAKKITIAKAAQVHSIGARIINDARKILNESKDIAKQVYKGTYNLQQAQYKIDEIERIKNPPENMEDLMDNIPLDGYSENESDHVPMGHESSAHDQNQFPSYDGSNSQTSEIKDLQQQLEDCMKEKELLISGIAS